MNDDVERNTPVPAAHARSSASSLEDLAVAYLSYVLLFSAIIGIARLNVGHCLGDALMAIGMILLYLVGIFAFAAMFALPVVAIAMLPRLIRKLTGAD